MENRFYSPLQRAITVLENAGYRYAIIGGLALSQWAPIRATEDIDLKVLVADMKYEKLRSLLSTEFPINARPLAPGNPFVVAVIIEDVIVDFLFTIPGHDELIVSRAIKQVINKNTYWICTAEDLIIQKMVAGREKDRLDVESIIAAQKDRLDNNYIKKWLREYDNVLEERNLLNSYRLLVEKTKHIPRRVG